MENYIMIFEDGEPRKATKVTEEDINAVYDGTLTIVRCSDLKQLNLDGEWEDIGNWCDNL